MASFDPYYQWLGIPPKHQPADAYRLLGVERFEANSEVIESALEQRMLLLRARQSGARAAQTQQLLNELSHAGRLLLDPALKAAYDQTLHARSSPKPELPKPEPSQHIAALPRMTPYAKRKKSPSSPLLLLAGLGVGAVMLMLVIVGIIITLNDSRTTEDHVTSTKPTTRSRRAATAEVARPRLALRPVTAAEPVPVVEQLPAATPESDSLRVIQETEELEMPAVALSESVVEPEAPRDEPVAPQEAFKANQKLLLTLADFKFVGAFKLPQNACGASTGFATGCLALRREGKKITLFSDSHLGTGGAIYEFDPPQATVRQPYPTATVTREWRDIYQGRKRKADGTSYELNGLVPTTGLRWDDTRECLWWAYGEKYNTENQDAPSFGASKLEGDAVTAAGPWKTSLPQSWQRGGTLEIPAWFAEQHCGGKRLGVGFGGYYSIFKGGSYGPALAAVAEPVTEKESGRVVLLGYPEPHFCPRDGNYHHDSPGWMGRDPQGDAGTWNATDEIGGEIHAAGAIWIDAADKHGVLFFCSLGTGRMAYEDGGIQTEGRENVLYVYDPADLAKVAAGKLRSWEPPPKRYPLKNPAPGLTGRAAGVAFDAASRRLYVVFTEAYVEGEEAYPVVVIYQI